jgi:hypothetical protein
MNNKEYSGLLPGVNLFLISPGPMADLFFDETTPS